MTTNTSMPATRRRVVPVLLGAALLGGACTSAADDNAGAPSSLPMGDEAEAIVAAADDSVAEVDSTPAPDADDFNLLLETETDLVDLRPVDVLAVDVVDGDDRRLLVTFEMESHHCHGVTTGVVESDVDVVVELRSGLRPGVSPADCEIGVYPYTAEIELASALDGRVISTAELREPAPEPERNDVADDAADEPAEVIESIGAIDVLPAADDTPALIGLATEDAVEWAIVNGVEWRLLSVDGESRVEDDTVDPGRIGFVVERDRVVAFDWG